ncbi:MAG: hypothetical protein OJF49_003259 [Ktedonobacterales bacterium]|jgi:hypothetical protein|nr:MAG: hypothetical protein OJF49_003259 [Ktedonobacterales bacterium]
MVHDPFDRKLSHACEAVLRALADLDLLDEMTESQLCEVRDHLWACARCAAAFRAYQRLDRFMQAIVRDPPKELVKALLAELPSDVSPQSQNVPFDSVLDIDDPLDAALAEMGYTEAPAPLPIPPHFEAWLTSLGDGSASSQLESSEGQEEPEHRLPSLSDDPHDWNPTPSLTPSHPLTGVAAQSVDNDIRSVSETTGELASTERSMLLGAEVLYQSILRRPALSYDDSHQCQAQMKRITSPEAIMRVAIDLLEHALDQHAPPMGMITLTWFLDTEILARGHPLWHDWNCSLRRALDHGWGVRHLSRATLDKHKAPRIAEYMCNLLGTTGLYEPWLLPADSPWHAPVDPGDSSDARYEFIIVPGVGGLRMVAPDGDQITQCRLLPCNAQLEWIESRLARGVAHARRVHEQVFPSPSLDYLRAILRIERHAAARLAMINGLGETAVPHAIHKQRADQLRSSGADNSEITCMLTLQQERERAMLQNLARYPHYDACPMRAIARLVETGVYQSQDTWMAIGAPPLTRPQVRELLTHLIERVDSQPNYHLLLLEDDSADPDPTEFLVKPGHSAMVEFWLTDTQGQRKRADIEIVEPSIVAALHDPALWNKLTAHALSDRSSVIGFLRDQMARL